jgi:hypothetical protein
VFEKKELSQMEEKTKWVYMNNQDNSIRYVLGTKGKKTLFVLASIQA